MLKHDQDAPAGFARAAVGAIGIASLIVGAGCSSGPAANRPRPSVKPGEFGSAACFYRGQVEDFTVLDESNLIVYAPNKSNAYHVSVSPPDPELKFASTLGFSSRSSEICGYARDALVLASAGGRRRASIFGVYRLNDVALSGLLTRFGLDPRKPGPVDRTVSGSRIDRSLDEPRDVMDKPAGEQTQ